MVQEAHFRLIIEVGVHDNGQEEVRDGAGEADAVSLTWTATDLAALAWVAVDLASIARARRHILVEGEGWRWTRLGGVVASDELGAADSKP
jgi:hypothetical protein